MPLQPEVIGDVDEGSATERKDEFGFSAEERAAWDAMQSGERDADGPAEPDSPAPPPAGADPAGGQSTVAAGADGTVPGSDPAAGATPDDPDGDAGPDEIKTGADGKIQRNINYQKHQRLLSKADQRAIAAEQRAQQAAIDNAKLAERLAILNQALMAPAPPDPNQRPENPWEEQTIDPGQDAIAALAQMQRRQDWANQNSTRQIEATQEQLDNQAMLNDYTRDVNAFASTPEGEHFFGQNGAYQYLKNSRLIEIGISQIGKNPTDPNEVFSQEEINSMIETFNQEEKWVVQNALSKGRSPAQSIVALARSRGWSAPARAPAASGGARAPAPARGGIPPGNAPAASAGAPGGSAVARLQAEQAGARAARSLSDGGGAPPPVELTPEALVSMKDDEFKRYVDNLPKSRLDALMGREMS